MNRQPESQLDREVRAALDKLVREQMAMGEDYIVVWTAIERIASTRGAR